MAYNTIFHAVLFYYLDANAWVKRYYLEDGTSWVRNQKDINLPITNYLTLSRNFLLSLVNLEVKMIHELDTVVLSHNIKEHNLRKGDIGAVVHCYKNNTVFEVEFVTAGGNTIALLTLTQDDIRPIHTAKNNEVIKYEI